MVRFMPIVAEAAGLSAMAIQRRAHLARRSISSRKNSNPKTIRPDEDDERLAVDRVAADAEAEQMQAARRSCPG